MRILAATALLIAATVAACSDSDSPAPSITVVPATPVVSDAPGVADRVTLRGTLGLDGAPFDAEFLGARVLRDGLAAACQHTIPPVVSGVYEIRVLAEAELTGCGAAGAEIVLWTYIGEEQHYSREVFAWPGDGETATFDATFSTSMPQGASSLTTDIAGEVFTAAGEPLPPGTIVEAFVGDVLCGRAALRAGSGAQITSSGFSIAVAGTASVPGCDEGATITFLVDGLPAIETADHDLAGTHLNLALQ